MTEIDQNFRQSLATSNTEGSHLGRLFWARPNKAAVIAGSIALLAVIIFFDFLTGPEINFPLVYIVPPLIVTWFVGRGAGYVVAAITAAGELIAELMGAAIYTHPGIAYWNGMSRTLLFILAVTLLSAFKELSTNLGTLVEDRTRVLRRLASDLSEAEDLERRRLAHDIHDGFSQMLSVLKLNLAAAFPESLEGSFSRQRVNDALGLVNELIQRARTLTFDLHPPMLDHLGLVPTLRHFSEQFSRQTYIEVTINEEGPSCPLARMTANYLFRSVKELINNAAKHGGAKQIVISAYWTAERFRVMVDDDGSGFDPATVLQPDTKCLGLAGINERLISLGGSFRMESSVGSGTRVVLEVPIVLSKEEK